MRRQQSTREKQAEQNTAAPATKVVSERYAGVSSIELKMTYYHRSLNPVLMERTLMLAPNSHAAFHMACMTDGCVNGGFDLGPVVTALVKSGKNTSKGKIICRGKEKTPGHASLGYQVTVAYSKKAGEKTRQP